MKMKVLVGVLIVLIAMNLAALGAFLAVQKQHRDVSEWHRGDRRARHERLMSQLGPEEREKVRASMKEFHEQNGDLMRETRQLEEDAIASMRKDPVPRAHIDSLLEQISANRLEIARRATDQMISLGETLTPEQREHLMNAIVRMRGGRRSGSHARDDDD